MRVLTILAAAALFAAVPASPQPTAGGSGVELTANTADARSYRSSSYRSSYRSSSWGRSTKSYTKPRSTSRNHQTKTRRKAATGTAKTRPTLDRKSTLDRKAGAGRDATGGSSRKPGGAALSSAGGTTKITRTSSYANALKKQRAAQAKKRRSAISEARSGSAYSALAGGAKSYEAKRVRERRRGWYADNPTFGARHQRFDDYGFERRSYGGFDPSFLMVMAMSDDPGDAALWYGLTGSPWLAMWMSDARESARAQGDQEALARLDAVERRVQEAPADAAPAAEVLRARGVPAEVAFAEDVLTGDPDITPKIAFGTGGKDGVYWSVCAGGPGTTGFKERVGDALDVTCVPTGGSKENVVDVVANEHQCVLAQSDVIDAQLRANPNLSFGPYQLNAYPEAFWLIVNDDSGIESVSDLDPSRHTLLMGGSGAAAAWANLAYHASGEWFGNDLYARFRPETVEREAGLKTVAERRDAAMLVVMGMNSGFMKTANDRYGDKVRLAAFDDGDFNDLEDREGNPIYSFATVPGGTYPKLQDGWWDSSVETLSVQAVVVCNERAVRAMGPAANDVLLTGLNMVIPDVRRSTLGLE